MNLDTLLRQEAQAFGFSDIDLNQELGLFPDVAPVTPAPTPAREWLGFATNPARRDADVAFFPRTSAGSRAGFSVLRRAVGWGHANALDAEHSGITGA